jgi:hypothetical protein
LRAKKNRPLLHAHAAELNHFRALMVGAQPLFGRQPQTVATLAAQLPWKRFPRAHLVGALIQFRLNGISHGQ